MTDPPLDSNGYPIVDRGQWDDITNEDWPPADVARRTRLAPHRIPVTVRVAWKHHGEETLSGSASKWVGRRVWVEFWSPHLNGLGAWFNADDVTRRD